MKKRVSIVLLIVICLMLTSCNLFRPAAKDTVTAMMDAIKKGDGEQSQKYFSNAADETKADEESAELDSNSMMEAIQRNLSYKIISSTEENDSATVVVEISNKDMKSVFGAYLKSILAAGLSGEYADMTEEEQDEYGNELLNKTIDEEENFVTTSVTLELTYEETEWKITPNEDLATAFFGGLDMTKFAEGETDDDSE